MRYTITSSQLNYFRKEGRVEFEDLYTVEEVESLKALLEAASVSSKATRDLQRENPPLLSALHTTRLGQLASGLCGKKRLRIAFTQYGPFFKTVTSLTEISSLTETCAGCIINLETGSTLFYQINLPIDFPALTMSYLLIVFATDKARYNLQEKDPCAHLLKKLGYGNGDLITEETHPLIIK